VLLVSITSSAPMALACSKVEEAVNGAFTRQLYMFLTNVKFGGPMSIGLTQYRKK
jgi:hypothetical protein